MYTADMQLLASTVSRDVNAIYAVFNVPDHLDRDLHFSETLT